jgi:hypothetical protein
MERIVVGKGNFEMMNQVMQEELIEKNDEKAQEKLNEIIE